jgi:hypothetical protein
MPRMEPNFAGGSKANVQRAGEKWFTDRALHANPHDAQ